jgi:hypothetical protein
MQSPHIVPAPQFGRSLQPVPPPRFGRLPHYARSPEVAASEIHDPDPRLVTPVLPQGDANARSVPPPVSLVDAAHVPGRPLAAFGARAVSFSIDFGTPVIVLNLLLAISSVTGGAAWRLVLTVVGYLGLLGFGLWNSGYLQGTTGRSLGRRVAHTQLVMMETGRPVGFRRAVIRQFCHLLEFGIGYLRPLWDGKGQTFAGKIVGTVVVRIGGPACSPDHRRVGE